MREFLVFEIVLDGIRMPSLLLNSSIFPVVSIFLRQAQLGDLSVFVFFSHFLYASTFLEFISDTHDGVVEDENIFQ